MKKITYRLTLDMKRIESEPMVVIDDSITALSVFANGGESLVREVAVRLRSGASPYDLNGISAYLFGKADGRYFCDCDVRDDAIYCVLPDELTAEAVTLCEIRLTDGSGAVATTPAFRVVSKKAIFSADDILRSNSFPALLTAIERADNARIVDSRIEQRELIITYGDGTEVNLGTVVGPMGPEGAAGPAGADGADGINGEDGSVWHYGTLITGEGDNIFMPVAGAKTGDYYLNTDTGAVYAAVRGEAKSTEWWEYITTLAGEKGEAFTYEDFTPEQLEALRGPAGADGKDGADGAPGNDGEKGDKGDKGDTGDKGDKGDKGDQGDKGEDGAAGTRFIAQAEKPTETDVLWLDTDDDSESGGGTAQPMEKLMFTGAVEAEYDGSEPVTVKIPQGGGGDKQWTLLGKCDLSSGAISYVFNTTDYSEIIFMTSSALTCAGANFRWKTSDKFHRPVGKSSGSVTHMYYLGNGYLAGTGPRGDTDTLINSFYKSTLDDSNNILEIFFSSASAGEIMVYGR